MLLCMLILLHIFLSFCLSLLLRSHHGMDTILVTHPPRPLFRPLEIHRKRHSFTLSAVLNKDLNKSQATNNESKTVYKDGFFHRLAINHLSHSLQASSGNESKESGFDGLVEAAFNVHRHFSPNQQMDIILKTLDVAAPKPVLNLMRKLMPPSKRTREQFAVMTTLFFTWLIGPCEVRESEYVGEKEMNVVHIPKCRFLEQSNCVGMCTNLCKMPSQEFIKKSLGVPINMVPNFDDMSCEMRFGEEPPPRSLDPVFKQPCYKQCKAIKSHTEKCTI